MAEKAQALVIRFTDWSETSRIVTLWTRELGKVRALAKGGRRLKSSFESALDLLTVCSIVLLRKSSGSLDLLTEAQVVERYPRLTRNLPALYAAYYLAELLSDWTEDYDPHPILFDEARAALRDLGETTTAVGPRLARYELVLLKELGYSPTLGTCAVCGQPASPLPLSPAAGETGRSEVAAPLAFSPAAGGVVCPACQPGQRDRRPLGTDAWRALQAWNESGEAWRREWPAAVRTELRQLLNHYVTYLLGRRPRLLPYLGS